MPERIFIAGSGRQSAAAAYDLARFLPGLAITFGDASLGQARLTQQRVLALTPELKSSCVQIDVQDQARLSELLRGHDAVLAGVPYHLNPFVHKAAREAGLPSVDMGSDLPDLEKLLGDKASAHSTAAYFDSGLAPGLGNQLARHLVESFARPEGARIYCGGLPLNPRTPFRYKPRFSIEGLIGEYSDPALALREGKVVEMASLSELEEVEGPGVGPLEAFVTSGGASIGPLLFEGRLNSYEYKTLRFPGHCDAMRAFRDLGLWEPGHLSTFVELFEQATEEEDPLDQVILIVEAWDSSGHRKRIDLRAVFDEATGFSAMEQLTGISAAIVLRHILESHPAPGLYAAEELVSGETMMEELGRRGLAFAFTD